MKIVELDEAKGSLSDYTRRNRRNAVVITRRGKPVAALLPLERGADLERLALSVNPRFRAILERSREEVRGGKVLSSHEVRRVFGLKRKAG
ncbi:MAG TPA: type II toxin-antitoxin system prevent-host-death family antitoxin [Vicinamibacteria bacterium]|nr:type II toxin-antitoxin system prevent-host-death family antitoxin [Vicinamibacteria bacterium]